jgi:hypothetical protein
MGQEKGRAYRSGRIGHPATVVLEGEGGLGLTEDYLRVEVRNPPLESNALHSGIVQGEGEHLHIDLSHLS